MKSRTSYSKLTAFKKDITRFAPLWGMYLVAVLLVVFETSRYQSGVALARNFIGQSLSALGTVNLLYAPVVALVLFGDLFQSRMCYSLHAMPQRRETWFFSHVAAGLCFSLVPNLVGAVYLMPHLEEYWHLAAMWLLAMELQYLFFFGTAVFSTQCAGNRLGMAAVYSLINGGALLLYWMIGNLYLPMMPGLSAEIDHFTRYCPVYELVSQGEDYFIFTKGGVKGWQFTGFGSAWSYTLVIAGVGLVLMALALLLYRRRALESAGDLVAFRALSPVLCILMTLCVGVVFAAVGDAAGNGYPLWLTVGVTVGYFGSRMLLERRVKVFRWKNLLGLGILVVSLWLSLFLTGIDAFGIVHWTPEPETVKSVTVSNSDARYNSNRLAVTVTDQKDIEKVICAHEDILSYLDRDYDDIYRVILTYELQNGRTVKRSYWAPKNTSSYQIIADYLYTPAELMDFRNWDTYVAGVERIFVDGELISKADHETLLNAVLEDCQQRQITVDGFDALYYLEIEYLDPDGKYQSRTLWVEKGAWRTISWIRENLNGQGVKF